VKSFLILKRKSLTRKKEYLERPFFFTKNEIVVKVFVFLKKKTHQIMHINHTFYEQVQKKRETHFKNSERCIIRKIVLFRECNIFPKLK